LGNLAPTRDFTYVRDTVNAFVEIAKSDKVIGQEINIATGTEVSVRKLARELILQLNPKARVIWARDRVRPKKSEVVRLLGSNKKIMSLTRWKPQYDLRAGLQETIRWFRDAGNQSRYKASLYSL